MEGSRLGQSDASVKTCVGRYAFFFLEVIGTTVTVPECPFAVSLLIINTGRHPSWTLVPGCFPSSANQMSPRCGPKLLCCSGISKFSSQPVCTCSIFIVTRRFAPVFIFLVYADFFLRFFLPISFFSSFHSIT